jgi:hypothetical protein
MEAISMTPDTWLTLSQLARKTDLSEPALQRLVSKLGHSLGGRNFGDIVKYPVEASETILIIADLYKQGWSSAEIIEILNQESPHLDKDFPPRYEASIDEATTLSENYDQISQLLLSTMRLANNLLSTTAILMTRLAALKKKIESLQREKQIIHRCHPTV